MSSSSVLRWLEHVHLRATDEPERGASGSSKVASRARTKGAVLGGGRPGGLRCYVSVSARSAASPGAASSKYHDRPGAEVVRDDGVDGFAGTRYSVIVSPAADGPLVNLVELADLLQAELQEQYGRPGAEVRTGMWIHHDSRTGGVDHLHVAIDGQGGRVVVTQRGAERAVTRALQALERVVPRKSPTEMARDTRAELPATAGQRAVLERAGWFDPKISRDDASRVIDMLLREQKSRRDDRVADRAHGRGL